MLCLSVCESVGLPFFTLNVFLIHQGYMLKQTSRLSKKYWHERYFVFRPDNTLEYYKKKDDIKYKRCFHISHSTGCETSDLFVQKHNKELVYCLRLTFTKLDLMDDDTDRRGGYNSDDDSSVGGEDQSRSDLSRGASIDNSHRNRVVNVPSTSGGSHLPAEVAAPPLVSPKIPRSPFKNRLHLHRNTESASSNIGTQSVDGGGTSNFTSRLRKRNTSLRRATSTDNNDTATNSVHGYPVVPRLIEVDPRLEAKNGRDAPSTMTPVISNRPLPRTTYEVEQDEEQDYLLSQYRTTQKQNQRKTKQKLVQGTKIAAAAGATVGLTVVTAGIGLMAGLIALGVAGAAGGGGAAVSATWGRKSAGSGQIVMACADYETVKLWKSILDAALESDTVQKSTWGHLFSLDGRQARAALLPESRSMIKREPSYGSAVGGGNSGRGLSFANNVRWKLLEGGLLSVVGSGFQGLRIYREERDEDEDARYGSSEGVGGGRRVYNNQSVDGKPCPPMKTHTVLSTSPLDAFLCLMSHGRVLSTTRQYYVPVTEHRASFEVIESIDEHTDVIRLVFRPLFLFPSWTASRDFVLYRCWRLEQDGCYVICYESVEHPNCPPSPDHVRGEMHSAFNIAPQRKALRKHAAKLNQPSECLVTATVQVDPKGWVPTAQWSCLSNQAYGDAFGITALLQLVDIRDAIDQDRFIAVAVDKDMRNVVDAATVDDFPPLHRRGLSPPSMARNASMDTADDTLNEDIVNYDFTYACNESRCDIPETNTEISSWPIPLTTDMWAEPDPNSFRVRGLNYKVDRKKCNAGPSIARLIAVDVVSVDKPIYTGFTIHPTERVQLALAKERELKAKGIESDMPPYIFVVNIALPGPPFYHGVYYYAINDISTIDGTNGSPSSKLCNKFFFGDSDEFRDRTFKLIPQIVQGNFIARKAVGSTPAIMGKKLRQLYVKNDRYFEVILDCGSSPVATGVIRLSLGYAKTLVVDMGFLFEGDEDEFLPERILGCVRMKNIDFGPRLRHVLSPPDDTEY